MAAPLQQLVRIFDELLHRVAGERGLLAADFRRRAGDDQHGQAVNVLQLAAAGAALGEHVALLGLGRRNRQQQHQQRTHNEMPAVEHLGIRVFRNGTVGVAGGKSTLYPATLSAG